MTLQNSMHQTLLKYIFDTNVVINNIFVTLKPPIYEKILTKFFSLSFLQVEVSTLCSTLNSCKQVSKILGFVF